MFWYMRKTNEIFIDLDGKTERKHTARLQMVRRRLRAAIEQGKLNVRDVWFYPSPTALHHHLIIRTWYPYERYQVQAWALYLGSDVYRACNNLFRESMSIGGPDLLIIDKPYRLFYREADRECACTEKHTPEVMKKCPVALVVRQSYAASDFFGKPNKEYPVWEHFGKVMP